MNFSASNVFMNRVVNEQYKPTQFSLKQTLGNLFWRNDCSADFCQKDK